MAAIFSRTLRSVEADGSRRRTMELTLAALIIGAWVAWFLLGRVAVYEVTDRARVEVEMAAHPLAAHVGGRVVKTHLELGRKVHADEVLIELDSRTEKLALEEARVRRDGLGKRIEALQLEVEAEEKGLEMHRKASATATEESRSRVAEGEALARAAELKLASMKTLREKGVVSPEELTQQKAAVDSKRAEVAALRLATQRLEEESAVAQIDRRARIAKLEFLQTELAALLTVAEVTIRKLEHDAELRLVRAPIDGFVGRASELRRGSVVQMAEVLGAIVPPGKPRVVAFFPVPSVGRIRPGQTARLRMDGFPWTQFGMPRATVTDVGNEPIDGHVRVELALEPGSAPAIPLEHGLSGTAEVEVEHASPADLVLRAVGKLLTTRPPDRSAVDLDERAGR